MTYDAPATGTLAIGTSDERRRLHLDGRPQFVVMTIACPYCGEAHQHSWHVDDDGPVPQQRVGHCLPPPWFRPRVNVELWQENGPTLPGYWVVPKLGELDRVRAQLAERGRWNPETNGETR